MRKLIIASCIFALAASVTALDVGVAAFYSPGMAMGAATEVNELKPFGVAGAFNLGINENWTLSFGGGYAKYKYREAPHVVPDLLGYAYFDEIPILMLRAGMDYGFPLAAFVPYVSAGAAAAFEFTDYACEMSVDVAPGLYAGFGCRYFVTDNMAIEAGPRYTYLFDNPAVVFETIILERAGERSQLLNFDVGFNYFF
ncbi:MAG: outer membrane beta-barrel protein [Candidatus Zixiibacteriota bacterium]|jgi:opacity protein-like surface antigen